MKMKISNERMIMMRKLCLVVLWYAFFFFMIMIARDHYQTFRDFHYHIAMIALVAIAMLTRKNFKLKLLSFIPAGIIVLSGLNYIYDERAEFGWEYRFVLLSRYCLIAGLVIFFLSIVLSKEDLCFGWRRSLGGILLILFVTTASVIKYTGAYSLYFPVILILLVGKLDKDAIREQMDLIAISMYINFLISMTVSVIKEPTLGAGGRYGGIFLFPVVVALLSVMALFSILHFLKKSIDNWQNTLPNIRCRNLIILALLSIFPAVMLFLSGNRAVMLGVLIIIAAFAVHFIRGRKLKTQIISFSLVGVLLIVGAVGIIWMSQNFNSHDFAEKLNIDSESAGYYFIDHLPSKRESSPTGVFKPGSVWASLDATSSDRLGIWVTGLKKVTWFGKNDTTIILPTGENSGHVHSTYIYWLLLWGILGGGLSIIWVLYLFFDEIIYLFHKKGEIIPGLFIMLAFGVLFVEKQLVQELLPTMMIVFSYRFFYEIEDSKPIEEA